MRRHGYDRRRVIVVGDGEQAFDMVARLARRADLGYHVVEMIPLDPRGNGNGTGSAAVLGRIETLAASQAIDEVFVALPLDSAQPLDRKSTRLNSSHTVISYAVFCLKKKKIINKQMLC